MTKVKTLSLMMEFRSLWQKIGQNYKIYGYVILKFIKDQNKITGITLVNLKNLKRLALGNFISI